ncbi:B22R protein [Salmon gill poxvirus]
MLSYYIFVVVVFSTVNSFTPFFRNDETTNGDGVKCYLNGGFGHNPDTLNNQDLQTLKMNLSGGENVDLIGAEWREPLSEDDHFKHMVSVFDDVTNPDMIYKATSGKKCEEALMAKFASKQGDVYLGPRFTWFSANVSGIRDIQITTGYRSPMFLIPTSVSKFDEEIAKIFELTRLYPTEFILILPRDMDLNTTTGCKMTGAFFMCSNVFPESKFKQYGKDFNLSMVIFHEYRMSLNFHEYIDSWDAQDRLITKLINLTINHETEHHGVQRITYTFVKYQSFYRKHLFPLIRKAVNKMCQYKKSRLIQFVRKAPARPYATDLCLAPSKISNNLWERLKDKTGKYPWTPVQMADALKLFKNKGLIYFNVTSSVGTKEDDRTFITTGSAGVPDYPGLCLYEPVIETRGNHPPEDFSTTQVHGSWGGSSNGSPLITGLSVQELFGFNWKEAYGLQDYVFIKRNLNCGQMTDNILSLHAYMYGVTIVGGDFFRLNCTQDKDTGLYDVCTYYYHTLGLKTSDEIFKQEFDKLWTTHFRFYRMTHLPRERSGNYDRTSLMGRIMRVVCPVSRSHIIQIKSDLASEGNHGSKSSRTRRSIEEDDPTIAGYSFSDDDMFTKVTGQISPNDKAPMKTRKKRGLGDELKKMFTGADKLAKSTKPMTEVQNVAADIADRLAPALQDPRMTTDDLLRLNQEAKKQFRTRVAKVDLGNPSFVPSQPPPNSVVPPPRIPPPIVNRRLKPGHKSGTSTLDSGYGTPDLNKFGSGSPFDTSGMYARVNKPQVRDVQRGVYDLAGHAGGSIGDLLERGPSMKQNPLYGSTGNIAVKSGTIGGGKNDLPLFNDNPIYGGSGPSVNLPPVDPLYSLQGGQQVGVHVEAPGPVYPGGRFTRPGSVKHERYPYEFNPRGGPPIPAQDTKEDAKRRMVEHEKAAMDGKVTLPGCKGGAGRMKRSAVCSPVPKSYAYDPTQTPLESPKSQPKTKWQRFKDTVNKKWKSFKGTKGVMGTGLDVQQMSQEGGVISGRAVVSSGPGIDTSGMFMGAMVSQQMSQNNERLLDDYVRGKYDNLSPEKSTAVAVLKLTDQTGSALMTGGMVTGNPIAMAGGMTLMFATGLATTVMTIYDIMTRTQKHDLLIEKYSSYSKDMNTELAGNRWCLPPQTHKQLTVILGSQRDGVNNDKVTDEKRNNINLMWGSSGETRIEVLMNNIIESDTTIIVKCAGGGWLRFKEVSSVPYVRKIRSNQVTGSSTFEIYSVHALMSMYPSISGGCSDLVDLYITAKQVPNNQISVLTLSNPYEPQEMADLPSDVCDQYPFKKLYVSIPGCSYDTNDVSIGWTTCDQLFRNAYWSSANETWMILNPFAKEGDNIKVWTFKKRDFRDYYPLVPNSNPSHRELGKIEDNLNVFKWPVMYLSDVSGCTNKIRVFGITISTVNASFDGSSLVNQLQVTCPVQATPLGLVKRGLQSSLQEFSLDKFYTSKRFMSTDPDLIVWIYCQDRSSPNIKSDMIELKFDAMETSPPEHSSKQNWAVIGNDRLLCQSRRGLVSSMTWGTTCGLHDFTPNNIKEEVHEINVPGITCPASGFFSNTDKESMETIQLGMFNGFGKVVIPVQTLERLNPAFWTLIERKCKTFSGMQLTLGACDTGVAPLYVEPVVSWTWHWIDQEAEDAFNIKDAGIVFKNGQYVSSALKRHNHRLDHCHAYISANTRELAFDCPNAIPIAPFKNKKMCLVIVTSADQCRTPDIACTIRYVETYRGLVREQMRTCQGYTQTRRQGALGLERVISPGSFCERPWVYDSDRDLFNGSQTIIYKVGLDMYLPGQMGKPTIDSIVDPSNPDDLYIKWDVMKLYFDLITDLKNLQEMKNSALTKGINQLADRLTKGGKEISRVNIPVDYLVSKQVEREKEITELQAKILQRLEQMYTDNVIPSTDLYRKLMSHQDRRCCILKYQDTILTVDEFYPDYVDWQCPDPSAFYKNGDMDSGEIFGPEHDWMSNVSLARYFNERPEYENTWVVCMNKREVYFGDEDEYRMYTEKVEREMLMDVYEDGMKEIDCVLANHHINKWIQGTVDNGKTVHPLEMSGFVWMTEIVAMDCKNITEQKMMDIVFTYFGKYDDYLDFYGQGSNDGVMYMSNVTESTYIAPIFERFVGEEASRERHAGTDRETPNTETGFGNSMIMNLVVIVCSMVGSLVLYMLLTKMVKSRRRRNRMKALKKSGMEQVEMVESYPLMSNYGRIVKRNVPVTRV